MGFWFAMSFVACSNTRRPLCGALQYSCKKKKNQNTVHLLFAGLTGLKKKKSNWLRPLWAEAPSVCVALGKLPFFCAAGILNPPHSFLLQASSPPASGLIVRVYYLTIYSLTPPPPNPLPFTHRGPQTTRRNIKQFCC